jgi:hypothetical protein
MYVLTTLDPSRKLLPHQCQTFHLHSFLLNHVLPHYAENYGGTPHLLPD